MAQKDQPAQTPQKEPRTLTARTSKEQAASTRKPPRPVPAALFRDWAAI